MINGLKVVVVLPAYNAAKTLLRTYNEVDRNVVDELILVDDASHDDTAEVARSLGIKTIVHTTNLGYGGNQKTCYREALKAGADIVIMLHPDYQYTPKLLPAMAYLIACGHYDCVLGSRIIGKGALLGNMPAYKYFFNRCLTAFQNILLSERLSEYHTGYRAFSRKLLEKLPLGENDNDFIFDNEMLAQIVYFDFQIGEISCPTRYEADSSSINFIRSCKYGLGVLGVSMAFKLQKWGLGKWRIFDPNGKRLSE
ncbi:MAG: glycosyltransferase family 2 protein [Acidobacteria bacterium]|nr:glycosyltransferase family 2 protein [Acidobacteriota bacterium]